MKRKVEKEEDGRWIAEVSDLPGVLTYGKTHEDAIAKVEAIALRVISSGTKGRIEGRFFELDKKTENKKVATLSI